MFAGGQNNLAPASANGVALLPMAGVQAAGMPSPTFLPIDPLLAQQQQESFPAGGSAEFEGNAEPVFLPLGPANGGAVYEGAATKADVASLFPPPPELTRGQKFSRWISRVFGFPWEVPLYVLFPEQVSALVGPNNPFGVHSDGKGRWVYPTERKDEILSRLTDRRCRLCGDGIIKVFPQGQGTDGLLLFPERTSEDAPPPFRLDVEQLRPAVAQAKPIVFYHEDDALGGIGGSAPGVVQWIQAMRELGYDIRYVGSIEALKTMLVQTHPDIVLVSAIENLLPYAQVAYFAAKQANPSAITILGGFAAIPEFADFYDVVVRGEGEIALPLILRNALRMLADGEANRAEPVSWGNMVGGLDAMLASPGQQSWFSDFARQTQYYPPVFSAEAAAAISGLTGVREVRTEDAGFLVGVPIGYSPKTGERKVFVRSTEGRVTAAPVPLDARYEAAVVRWQTARQGVPFPLTKREFAAAAAPEVATQEEIDVLYARHPLDVDAQNTISYFGSTEKRPYDVVALYAQRGCRGDSRCVFCSIPQKAEGRRPSIDQIVRIMQTAVANEKTRFLFNDDNFVQNKAFVAEFLDRIEAEGLHQRIRIHIQTRVDSIPQETMARLRHLGVETSMGLETLSPSRAERLGKVPRGSGAKYVDRARATMQGLAETKVAGDDFYMITVAHGDTLLDIAEDTLAQLETIGELWTRYKYLPHFRYSLTQAPYYGDMITGQLSGLPNAQPGSIPASGPQWATFGEVRGIFDPYGVAMVDGAVRATGIFHPMSFVWPEPIRAFLAHFGDETSGLTIGDIVAGLRHAEKEAKTLGEAERQALHAVIEKIGVLYARAIKRISNAESRLMSREETDALRDSREDMSARRSGVMIRY